MADRLNLEGLRYARAVAESESFSAAARSYGVTQPALSNGIAKLEEQLGKRLFTRSTRGMTPTPFGDLILPMIERAMSALDSIDAEANRWNPPKRDNIRMGVSPLINPDLIARAYSVVRDLDSAPDQLVLKEANLADLRADLAADELDFIIVPSVGPLPRYEHRVIDSEPLVLIDSNRDSSEPVDLTELGDKQFIVLPDTCGLTTFTHDLLGSHDLPLRLYPGEATSYRVLEEWSNLGLGSAMLPQSKLTNPDTAPRHVLEDGTTVEIFYEAAWDPQSPIAHDLQTLAERLNQH